MTKLTKTMILGAFLAMALGSPTLAHDMTETEKRAFEKTTKGMPERSKLRIKLHLGYRMEEEEVDKLNTYNQIMGIMWVLRAAAGIDPGDVKHPCYVDTLDVFYAHYDGRLNAFTRDHFGKAMDELAAAGPMYLEYVRSIAPEGCYPGTRWRT